MRLIALNLALALALTLTACGGGDDDTTPPPEPDTSDTGTDTGDEDTAVEDTEPPPPTGPYDAVVEALTEGCGSCHGGADGCSYTAACFLDDVSAMSQPVVNSAACGDATDVASCSVARMNDGTMPPYGALNAAPTADEIQVLQDWIDAGMPTE